MRNQILKLAIVAISIVVMPILSCKKHDMDHNSAEPKNINYSAVYVVNGSSNTISVIELASETVKETIDLNGATFPHHIYLSPDNKTLLVAITSTDLSPGHNGGHSGGTASGYKVLLIDATTAEIHHEILLDKLPHNATFSNDGKEIWIGQASDVQSSIKVYSASSYTLLNIINVGKGLSETTFSTNGSKVFAANTMDGTVSVINPLSKMVESIIPTGTDPVGAWNGENGYMYVDNETSQTVTEINVSDLSKTDTINLGFKPGYVAFTGQHNELWVSDATNGKVVYYTLQANNWIKAGEITTGADAHAIAFTSDGTKAYVTNQGAGTISVINPITHQVIKNIIVGSKPNGVVVKQ